MNIRLHNEYLLVARELTRKNPDLDAEYQRRSQAGEWFRAGEPVTKYMKQLNSLNKKALMAVNC